jgi:polyisoprenyl-teichoic acid--peptidoglycan teichoic acid transferase
MARKPNRKPPLDNVTKGLLLAFAVVGILLAYFGGKAVFSFFKSYSLTNLPGAPVQPTTDPNATAAATQIFQSGGSSGTPWDGKSRVNILLLGLDYSQERGERGLTENLTDTMILVTIDPISQTIGAMSIRRDLWVEIPHGYGYDKINTAYAKGLRSDVPGVTGPSLVMETVENFLGVDINFYAIVNLDTFVKLIDEIDGVKIEVKSPMLLDWNGTGEKFWIQPGTYTMPGQYALAYARCRTVLAEGVDCGDDTGDIGRGGRQMEVITAMRNRIMDFDMLPLLISRAPAIYADVSSGVQTDMSLDEAIQLATLMMRIPRTNMTTYNIDYTMVEPQNIIFNGYNYNVLVPYPDKIRILRDQMFSTGASTAPIALGTNDALALAVAEGARIQILNGTMTGNLADTTADFLRAKGLNVVSTGNTDSTTYTSIVINGAVPYTAAYLQNLMAISANLIVSHYDPNASADIIIYLGEDWASSGAMNP